MPIEIRSAITGHSAKMDESAAYGAGMGTFVQVVAGYLAKVRSPLDADSAGRATVECRGNVTDGDPTFLRLCSRQMNNTLPDIAPSNAGPSVDEATAPIGATDAPRH
jgi:hypothetical protein